MTQNTKQMMLFKDIFHKKVVADFNGGDVSSDAGLLFLREVESGTGIIKRVANVLKDKRHLGYVKHQFIHLLKQRVFQIASGYEDANDSDELKNDPISQRVTETAGIYNTVGFNNDTRSFPSIPARHDLSRRIDSNFLGRLVAQHIIDMEDARKMSQSLTYDLVKKAYKL